MKIQRKNTLPSRKIAAKEMPMKDSQFDKMTVPELKELQLKVERAIVERQAGERNSLKEKFKAMAEEAGLTLVDVLGGSAGGRSTKGRPVAAKFANPANSSETWSGRGRKPNWMSAKLKAGSSMDDFRI